MPAAFATLSRRWRRGSRKGVFVPAAAHTLDPHRLVTGLAEHFERQGGSFRRACVDRILAVESERAAIEAGGEKHDHDVVVVAAGVWSKPLVAGLGYPVPLVAQRGYHVTFTNPGVALGRVVLPLAHAATIVPMAMGIRIGGTVEFAGEGAPPNSRRAEALSRHAKATIPALDMLGSARLGWARGRARRIACPCSAGRRAIPAVLFAFGHGHQGLIGAAKTAEVIADLVAERPPRLDLAPFDVRRFGFLPRLW